MFETKTNRVMAAAFKACKGNVNKTNAAKSVAAFALAAGLGVALPGTQAEAETVTVTFENLQAQGGVFTSPLWVGFHNGSFDPFNAGTLASSAIEHLAEDGDSSGLAAMLLAGQADAIGGVITSPGGFPGLPLFDPGESASQSFELDPMKHRYLSFAAMVVPSNDAFLGSDNAIELFDAEGNFVGGEALTLLGSHIWDAGTEDNRELDAAFVNQTTPNTGFTTADPIMQHPGFVGSVGNPTPGLEPFILGQEAGGGYTVIDPILGDFTRNQGQDAIARLTIATVPEPASVALIGLGALAVASRRPRK